MPSVDIAHTQAKLHGFVLGPFLHTAAFVNQSDMGLSADLVDFAEALINDQFEAEDILVKDHRTREIAVILKGDGECDVAIRALELRYHSTTVAAL